MNFPKSQTSSWVMLCYTITGFQRTNKLYRDGMTSCTNGEQHKIDTWKSFSSTDRHVWRKMNNITLPDWQIFFGFLSSSHMHTKTKQPSNLSILLTHTKLQTPSCAHMVVQSKVLTGPSSPINPALEKVGTVKGDKWGPETMLDLLYTHSLTHILSQKAE